MLAVKGAVRRPGAKQETRGPQRPRVSDFPQPMIDYRIQRSKPNLKLIALNAASPEF